MAFGSMALSLMLDFKCIINPYQVYVHDRGWDGEKLLEPEEARLHTAMGVMMELTTLLSQRSYRSEWSV